ncbi:uncharacterized protein LOC129752779 [Uranotaenia lowii]|uniref:uncharacterized protein LOC129752779 n=1 Tax=Uranotaenia lowii TaxID=190385 RepID=UPI0024799276|nr:uncharacterized protein LOC129752779 [Uranotaenia lowii]
MRNPRMSYVFRDSFSRKKVLRKKQGKVTKRNVTIPSFLGPQTLLSTEIQSSSGSNVFSDPNTNIRPEVKDSKNEGQCLELDNTSSSQYLQNMESMNIDSESESVLHEENFKSSSNETLGTDEETPDNDIYHPGLNVRKTEILFMLMNIFIKHNLTNSALEDILSMLNIILGSDMLPKTFTKFSEFFSKNAFSRHYFCEVCIKYIGTEKTKCYKCDKEKLHFFITFDVVQNLKDVLLKNWESFEFFWRNNMNHTKTTDMVTAKVVQERKRTDNNSITLSLNTDGFHSLEAIRYGSK